MEGTQEGQISYLAGDVPVEYVRFMPVSLAAASGPGTVCTGAQRGPAQVEPLGAQTFQEGSQHSSPPHCAHVKSPTRVQLPVLQSTNARFTPGRGSTFWKNSGDHYKRHPARIDMVSVTNAVTFTRASANARVGAIEHPQIQYPHILMDWVAGPLRETQPRPRPLQRKLPTKANSLHRAYFCCGE